MFIMRRKRESTKGALIKGMLNMVPTRFLEDPKWSFSVGLIIKKPGIYVLYDSKKKPIYVGMGQNVFSRIQHHFKDKCKDKWSFFSIFVAEKKHIKDLETLALNLLDPPLNKIQGQLPPEHRYNDFLKWLLKEEEKDVHKLRSLLQER